MWVLFNSQIFSFFLLSFDTFLTLIYSIYFCGGIYLNLLLFVQLHYFLNMFVYFYLWPLHYKLMFVFYFNYRCIYLSHNLSKVHSDSYTHIISNFLNLTIVLWSLSSFSSYIVLAFIRYLNSLSKSHLSLFDSIIQLFASIDLYWGLSGLGTAFSIYLWVNRQPFWILPIIWYSQHIWNAHPHLGEPILLSLGSICHLGGHF